VVSDQVPEHLLRRRRTVGARIRQAREARELSQEKLAELSGLGRVTIVRTELGLQSARLDHLYLIADALGVPLSHLVRD
jgi:transcriptional regulator with XRE-family HTH domain